MSLMRLNYTLQNGCNGKSCMVRVLPHTHQRGGGRNYNPSQGFLGKRNSVTKGSRGRKDLGGYFFGRNLQTSGRLPGALWEIWATRTDGVLEQVWKPGREAVASGVSVSGEGGQVMLSPGPRGLRWVGRFKEVRFSVLANLVGSPRQKSRGLGRIQLKSGPSCAEHEVIMTGGEICRTEGDKEQSKPTHRAQS